MSNTNYKFKSTNLADYFETGSSSLNTNTNVASTIKNFPTFSTASFDYEKITDSYGYKYNGQDLTELYNIKSKSVQYNTNGSGTVTIPTWANAIKVRIDSKQGAQGQPSQGLLTDGSGRFPSGTPGTSYGEASDGSDGDDGPYGTPYQVKGCPTGGIPATENRTKSGGRGGFGGTGGTGGRAVKGGDGGLGGLGAVGGVGGYGKTYYSSTISDLSVIRGTGSITYNITDSACQLTGPNFGLIANAGGTGNNAQGGNSGQPGQDAKASQAGQDGGNGQKGGNGGTTCGAPGTGHQEAGTGNCYNSFGCDGADGEDGADGSDGDSGADGDNATAGQRGLSGTVTETGDFQNTAESTTDVDNQQNRIIVHYFLH
tara:strand:+ start:20 stop:1132 length:1113 start_codon:yes stop_codon:yes gene_type:complete